MLRFFHSKNNCLTECKDTSDQALFNSATWIDAHAPTESDTSWLSSLLQTEIPDQEDVEEIESSARFFSDKSGIHVRSLFLTQSEGRHKTTTVAFILQDDRLITIREDDLADFRLLRMRIRRSQIESQSPYDLLISIMSQKIENLADIIEEIHERLDRVSHLVLEDENGDLEDAISQLAKLEDSNGKIRLCLTDTQRSITFLKKTSKKNEILIIERDMETLMQHTSFLFDKINFLMNSTQGFISIDQNKIIKIFSIAAVVFLPPTLVASIYGMNFQFMPELNMAYGYPMAIVIMVLSGIAPYLFFKKKGWL